jgi:hypothetical protein
MLGTFLSGVVGHHYIGKILDYKNEMAASKDMEMRAISEAENMEIVLNKLDSIIKQNEYLSKNVETLLDKHVPESQLSIFFCQKKIEINELLEIGGNQCKIVKEILDKDPDNINLDIYQAAYRAAVRCDRANSDANEAVKKLIETINGNNNLVSDFNLEDFYKYLNSLNLIELSALYHIIVLALIAILSINVLSAVLGNEIINYFKLEENFPKLAAFLRLRLNFQRYYLILNFL